MSPKCDGQVRLHTTKFYHLAVELGTRISHPKVLIQKSDPQRYSYRWGIRSLTNFGDFINPANRQAQLLAYQPPKSVLSINYINQVRLYNQVHHIFYFSYQTLCSALS